MAQTKGRTHLSCVTARLLCGYPVPHWFRRIRAMPKVKRTRASRLPPAQKHTWEILRGMQIKTSKKPVVYSRRNFVEM